MVCLIPLINKGQLHHFTHSMKVSTLYINFVVKVILILYLCICIKTLYNLEMITTAFISFVEFITIGCKDNSFRKSNIKFFSSLLLKCIINRHLSSETEFSS